MLAHTGKTLALAGDSEKQAQSFSLRNLQLGGKDRHVPK